MCQLPELRGKKFTQIICEEFSGEKLVQFVWISTLFSFVSQNYLKIFRCLYKISVINVNFRVPFNASLYTILTIVGTLQISVIIPSIGSFVSFISALFLFEVFRTSFQTWNNLIILVAQPPLSVDDEKSSRMFRCGKCVGDVSAKKPNSWTSFCGKKLLNYKISTLKTSGVFQPDPPTPCVKIDEDGSHDMPKEKNAFSNARDSVNYLRKIQSMIII